MELALKNGLTALFNIVRKFIRLIPAVFIMLFSYFVTFMSICTGSVYRLLVGNFNARQLGFITFTTAFAVLIFVIIPLLVNKFIFRRTAADIGLKLPRDKIRGILLTCLALAISLPIFMILIRQPSIKHFYSFGAMSIFFLVGVQLFTFPLYYFAEEFFFRGFVFLNLWDRIGWHSFWFSEILFVLVHIGKPPLEVAVSAPVSVLLNYITLRTRSIYPALFVHMCIGLMTFTVLNIRNIS